ncbi:MAG TPA: hypothetical protein VK629_13150 [Steroidobacteraceae bacterium]|nr:hypothetical protein [Steroidobacteraceae bacterium]
MKNWLRALAVLTVAVSTVLASAPAWSVPYFEAGDAGQSLAGAQAVGNDVNVIDGNIALDSADLYSFKPTCTPLIGAAAR